MNDLGRQPVAVFEAVRHDEIDLRAEAAHAPHRHCASSRTVGIVIGDHHEFLVRGDRIGKQSCHFPGVCQFLEQQQPGNRSIQLFAVCDTA